MKKRNIFLVLTSLLSVLLVPSINGKNNNNSSEENTQNNNQIVAHNLGNENNITVISDNAQKVIDYIIALENKVIDYSSYQYIQEIWYAYHTLTTEEKTQIGEHYNVLVEATNTVNKAKVAHDFDEEFNYLLNDGTFAYKNKLEELKTQYNSFDNETKAFVTSYNNTNLEKIKENALNLTPDIYYDFSTAEVDGTYLVNQGKLAGKNAKLKGNANVNNGYLSFGGNSLSDGSCLELPSDMFSTATDFTFSVVYEKTASVGNFELVFTFGTNEYHNGSTYNRMGFRVQYCDWNNRGPFYMFAYKGDMSKEFGHGPQMTPADDTLHTYCITVRYLSKAKALQIHNKDLVTEKEYYVNYALNGAGFSGNNYVELDSSNFDFRSFDRIYLGARDGSSNGNKSFQGKYLSFSYYSSLVTEREMYGKDDRNINVGARDTLEYVNSFEKVGSSFAQYKELYAPEINRHYKVMVSCPYDYQKFFDPEHVEYFMEAYNIVNS